MTRQESARQALGYLQRGEVTRVMGYASTPEQIRAKADYERNSLYRLAKDVEDLAALANATPNRRRKRTSSRKRTSRRAR